MSNIFEVVVGLKDVDFVKQQGCSDYYDPEEASPNEFVFLDS